VKPISMNRYIRGCTRTLLITTDSNNKGKVESGIQYAKGNFFKGRTVRIAIKSSQNGHIKQTGGYTVLQEVFESEEKIRLLPLPESRYRLVKAGSRIVYYDCHVFVDYNCYSVPFEYAQVKK
jgi:hypothetical protein